MYGSWLCRAISTFKFIPGEPGYSFTPYITLGAGVFNYDPFAYLDNKKYSLRSLGTEGQAVHCTLTVSPITLWRLAFHLVWVSNIQLNQRTNVGFEVVYRFTTSDYIDDVSTTYVDAAVFPPLADGSPSPAQRLSDRVHMNLVNPSVFPAASAVTASRRTILQQPIFFITFNLQSYRCPTAN